MKMRYIIVLAAAFALLAAPVAGHAQTQRGTTHVTLILDWYPNTDHAGIYAAQDQGFFRKAGLDVSIQIPSGATSAVKLVAAGRADFAVNFEPDVLISRSQGVPVKSVMAITKNPLDSVASLKTSHITRPRDLKGKTVGVTGLPSDTADLEALLSSDGLKMDDIKTVNIGYNVVPALISHKVDASIGAFYTWEALQMAVMGHPANTIRLQKWGVPNFNQLVIITSDSMVQHNPSVVRAVVHALARGYTYSITHQSVIVSDLLRAYHGFPKALLARSMKTLAPQFKTSPSGWQPPAEWQRYEQWMVQHKLLTKSVAVNQAMTNAFVR